MFTLAELWQQQEEKGGISRRRIKWMNVFYSFDFNFKPAITPNFNVQEIWVMVKSVV